MSATVVVRYRTRPEAAQENSRLIAGVFAALAEAEPADFRYTTYRLADEVSFVHIATFAGEGNPLIGLPAFAEFQRELGLRCEEQPEPSKATVVGAYGSTS